MILYPVWAAIAPLLGNMDRVSSWRSNLDVDSQADVNPELMMSFMSLMADFVRVHLVVASITERKQALGMYYCAHATVHGKKTTPAMAKVCAHVLCVFLFFVPGVCR